MWVNNHIKESTYSQWEPGDIVLIDAPTGAGKTFFVLNELVKYAASKGKDVVFLCNRISIKSQLVNSIFKAALLENKPIPDNLYILTYQKCEKIGNFNKSPIKIKKSSLSEDEKAFYAQKKGETITIDPQNVMYFLFDEPQHLISGASFDVSAQFWEPRNIFNNNSIFVFTTATPEPLYLYFYYHFSKDHHLKLDRFSDAKRKRNEIQNEINLLDPFYEIHYEEKKKALENDLEKYSKKSIWVDMVDEIKNSFSKIHTLEITGHNLHIYNMPRDFSVYNCFYFCDFDDLIFDIIASKEKWLIFINDENEGAAFKERLNVTYQLKCNKKDEIASLLSVRTRKDKKGDAYIEYSNITEVECFSNKVLIATSIIDCGVNIKDENVKNVVVAQSDKTTFLQMLGRRRTQPRESINLFIKVFSASQIHSLSKKNKEKITEVSDFLSLDSATYWSKISGEINTSVERQRRMLESDISNRNLADLLTVNLPKYDKLKTTNFDVKDVVVINKNKLICCFYLIYLYYGAILNKADGHLHHYLITQLSWINFGKEGEYQQKAWIIPGELREEIEHFLNINTGIIESADIELFKALLLTLFLEIPPMAFPANMQKDLSRYQKIINGGKGSWPSLQRFNEIFESFNFKYQIENKYTYPKRKKVTNWLLKELPSEE